MRALQGQTNPHPIQVLVNYWEIRPSRIGAKLDDLMRLGVTHIASFIPWQAVESDITHTLSRFLQAVSERRMTVSLIITPEMGVHFKNSGIPKDLLSKSEHLAKHHRDNTISVTLPPNAFALPSLLTQEFTKRFSGYLSKVDGVIADLVRAQPRLADALDIVLTGSFWKYYRAPEASTGESFGSVCGDFSISAAIAFRQRVDQAYQAREFADPTPAAANRWKTRALEETNRRWFEQQSEDVFRLRSTQSVRRKSTSVSLRQMELFTPEADPGFAYSSFLQLVSGGRADFARFSDLIDEASTRASHVGEQASPSYIHWSGLGGFQTLSDPEKQFLMLKALVLFSGRGGGILVSESEWFGLSPSFRSRAESIGRLMANGDLRLRDEVLYVAPHLWSGAGTLWESFVERVGNGARLVASLDYALACDSAKLLIVDPGVIITREAIQKLLEWTASGRIAVVPSSPLFTELAKAELRSALKADPLSKTPMALEMGVAYLVHAMTPSPTAPTREPGKFILYDLPEGLSMHGESSSAWRVFAGSLIMLAGIEAPCQSNDARLQAVTLSKKNGGNAVFVFNSTTNALVGELTFSSEVTVSDLASSFAPGAAEASQNSGSAAAKRFSLEVPPCGILPVAAWPAGSRTLTLQTHEKSKSEAAHVTRPTA